jgi:hypothetical protein
MRRTTAPRIEFIEFLSRKLCAPSERAASQRCVRRFLNAISIACSIQRPGFKDVNLPNAPIGSPEFCAAYFAALRGENVAQVASIAATSAGSVNAVVAQFFEKADSFKVLKPSTQKLRRALLNKFCKAHGDKPFAQIDRDYIDRLFNAMPSPVALCCSRCVR